MTPEEEAWIAQARTLAHTNRAQQVAGMMVPLVETRLVGGSRDFLGIAFDLACRSIFSTEGHSEAPRERVARLCRQSEELWGPQPWTVLYRACLLHLEGDHDTAVGLYRLAERETNILWPNSVGCRTVFTREAGRSWIADESLDAAISQEVETLRRRRRGGRVVAFAAADGGYLRRFGDAFMASAAREADGCILHLHVINLDLQDHDWLTARLRDEWPDVEVTSETYAGADARSFFALVRFIRAPTLLERYGLPVVLSDIDAVYEANLAASVEELGTHDVGLRMKHVGFRAHPWQTIQAGVSTFWPSSNGIAYARRLSRLALGIFREQRGRNPWFADQNALYHARLLAQCDGWAARLLDLTERGLPGRIRFGKAFPSTMAATASAGRVCDVLGRS